MRLMNEEALIGCGLGIYEKEYFWKAKRSCKIPDSSKCEIH